MTDQINRRIVMAARPVGAPRDGDFRLEETEMPEPGTGEMLCRTLYLSLDPYMRGRMHAAKSYAPRVEVGGLMVGGAVSEVLRSKADESASPPLPLPENPAGSSPRSSSWHRAA